MLPSWRVVRLCLGSAGAGGASNYKRVAGGFARGRNSIATRVQNLSTFSLLIFKMFLHSTLKKIL